MNDESCVRNIATDQRVLDFASHVYSPVYFKVLHKHESEIRLKSQGSDSYLILLNVGDCNTNCQVKTYSKWKKNLILYAD